MKNREIAAIFYEIADFLEIEDVEYKPRAYRTAARNIETLSEDIADIHARGELEEIDGVGKSIAEKIVEYLETDELSYYEELKADLPIDIDAITSVEGVGPKTAKKLYQALGIATLEDLELAAKEGRIAEVPGFGKKSQTNILDHIELAKQGQERILLGEAFPIAENIQERLQESGVFDQVTIVGSFRRRRPTVGDIDILATAPDPKPAMEFFCSTQDVTDVLARGVTKSSVIVSGDLHMDLRIVSTDEYGAALVYFTGSKAHNITLRNRAISDGLKLNEYGLFDVDEVSDPQSGQRVGVRVAGETEADVYETLGLSWIPPMLREDMGEVDAAAAHDLPDLVELADIKGDLQMHTTYSDGSLSVRELAEAANDRGLEYIAITDHGPGAPIPSKLNAASFEQQRADIEAVNSDDEFAVTVLQGIEAEITSEGITTPDEWLAQCDLVVAGLHGRPQDPTDVIIEAFRNAPIDIFAHPTNRLLNEREPVEFDLGEVMETAADQGIAIEINAQPKRLDLAWASVKEYRDLVDFVVSTDAHTQGELDHMHLGVSQAQRGWCEPANILNTSTLQAFSLVDI